MNLNECTLQCVPKKSKIKINCEKMNVSKLVQ